MIYLLMALAPVSAIILYVLSKDKFDKEPPKVLIICFVLGIICALPAAIVEELLIPIIDVRNFILDFIQAFCIIALAEEGAKYIIVRYYAYHRPSFNEPLDGIVYSLMVSMGFAAIENIMYVYEGGVAIAILRALTAVPAHATFAIVMGYFVGKAKFHKNSNSTKNLMIGFIGAVILHGAYDYCIITIEYLYIGLGALISLIIGIRLSLKALKEYHEHSMLTHSNSKKDMV